MASHQSRHSAISRRVFVKGAAIGAGAAVTSTKSLQAADRERDEYEIPVDPIATVTATIVRADHTPTTFDRLRLGVRTSIHSAAWSAKGKVIVVDGVDFVASPSEVRSRVEREVQSSVADMLNARGIPAQPQQIAVRVFGGAG